MKSIVPRFSFVLVVALLLSASFAFAKAGPPVKPITYSWSVVIAGANLKPVNGSTYTVTTFRSLSTPSSHFRFEALFPSQVALADIALSACSGDCGKINSVFGTASTTDTLQPDGDIYQRIEFIAYFNEMDFESMNTKEVLVFDSTTHGGYKAAGVYFNIDETAFGLNNMKNWIYGDIIGYTKITRIDLDTWSIECSGTSIDLVERAYLQECNSAGKRCKSVGSPKVVAEGTAEPMAFELIFHRTGH
jgi:hypothetical protein